MRHLSYARVTRQHKKRHFFSKLTGFASVAFLVLSLFGATTFSFKARAQDIGQGSLLGSITVCKIIIDPDGKVLDGVVFAGVNFSIAGFIPVPETSEGPPAGVMGSVSFPTPLTVDVDIVNTNSSDDGQCETISDLALGGYFYSEETISSSGWGDPKYNDQYLTPVEHLSDFFVYDDRLFDAEAGNDSSRDTNVDGHIVLTPERPDRTLIVLNQLVAPTLTVIKEVVNDDEGTAIPGDFQIHVKTGGSGVSSSPQAGSATGTIYTLTAGEYTVSEDAVDGYTATFSGDCDSAGVVTLNFGDDKTCAITNDDDPADDGENEDGGNGGNGGNGGGGGGSTTPPPSPPPAS